MKWCGYLLFLWFLFLYTPTVTPALSKAGIQETKKLMKNICKRTSHVKQESLDQFKMGDFVDDPKLKCYVHCCLGMMKVMKKDKITVPEATKQAEAILPEDMRKSSLKQLHSCKDVGGHDACDKAYNFAKCGYGVDPENFLIPT